MRINVTVIVVAVLFFVITGQMVDTVPDWVPAGVGPCITEDSDGPCYFDAESRGDGKGRSFWVDGRNMLHFQ